MTNKQTVSTKAVDRAQVVAMFGEEAVAQYETNKMLGVDRPITTVKRKLKTWVKVVLIGAALNVTGFVTISAMQEEDKIWYKDVNLCGGMSYYEAVAEVNKGKKYDARELKKYFMEQNNVESVGDLKCGTYAIPTRLQEGR